MKQTLWYKNPLVISALLVFFFPLGLFLMWKYTSWNKKVKWTISAVITLFLIIGVSQSKQTNSQVTRPLPQTQQNVAPSPTPVTQVERLNIVATSQIVKKVSGKYRYFFDIRNMSDKKFEGSVSIMLFNSQLKNPLAIETFTTKQAIEPTLGTSVYLDANTGPVEIHGDYGLSKFKYVVKVGGQEVGSGEGEISDQFESLDY